MSVFSTSDFAELVIKHLVRSKKCFDRAKEINLTSDDFMLSAVEGIKVYKDFVDICCEVGSSPISQQIFCLHVKELLNKPESTHDLDQLADFIEFIYSDPLDEGYVYDNLINFIRDRRTLKLEYQHKDSVVNFADEYAKLKVDISFHEHKENILSYSPFEKIDNQDSRSSIMTGIPLLDATIDGFGYQECVMLVGYSGGGKTATAVNFAIGCVNNGKKVLFISLEEPGTHISNRLYAHEFGISYTTIHKNYFGVRDELRTALSNLPESRKQVLKNIRVEDLRAMVSKTAITLRDHIEQIYQDTGVNYDLVIIDQMDYLDPISKIEQDGWKVEEEIAFNVEEELSNYLVGGIHPMAVCLLHQAKGSPKKKFKIADIAGFKGVVKPFDMVIGVGRDEKDSSDMSLFSLKVRHVKDFTLDFRADFEFMRIIDSKQAYAEAKTHASYSQKELFTGCRKTG